MRLKLVLKRDFNVRSINLDSPTAQFSPFHALSVLNALDNGGPVLNPNAGYAQLASAGFPVIGTFGGDIPYVGGGLNFLGINGQVPFTINSTQHTVGYGCTRIYDDGSDTYTENFLNLCALPGGNDNIVRQNFDIPAQMQCSTLVYATDNTFPYTSINLNNSNASYVSPQGQFNFVPGANTVRRRIGGRKLDTIFVTNEMSPAVSNASGVRSAGRLVGANYTGLDMNMYQLADTQLISYATIASTFDIVIDDTFIANAIDNAQPIYAVTPANSFQANIGINVDSSITAMPPCNIVSDGGNPDFICVSINGLIGGVYREAVGYQDLQGSIYNIFGSAPNQQCNPSTGADLITTLAAGVNVADWSKFNLID